MKAIMGTVCMVLCGILVILGMFHTNPNRKGWRKINDNPTGDWLNAGVIYDPKYLAELNKTRATREAAAYTQYIEDYVLPIKRPSPKPYPTA